MEIAATSRALATTVAQLDGGESFATCIERSTHLSLDGRRAIEEVIVVARLERGHNSTLLGAD